jgi:hypothetical protein
MAYRNIETGQEGSLRKLLPNVSNPHYLSEEELSDLGIEFFNPTPVETPEPTIEEVRERKLKEITNQAHEYIINKYPYYKQLSALNGTYDETTATEIKTWCDAEVKRAISAKEAVKVATTVEEIEAVYYMKDVWNEDLTEKIDTTFWGE